MLQFWLTTKICTKRSQTTFQTDYFYLKYCSAPFQNSRNKMEKKGTPDIKKKNHFRYIGKFQKVKTPIWNFRKGQNNVGDLSLESHFAWPVFVEVTIKTEKIKICGALHLKHVYGRWKILYWALGFTIQIHIRSSPCHITRTNEC